MAKSISNFGSSASNKNRRIRFQPGDVATSRKFNAAADTDATRKFLYTMLLEKEPAEEDDPPRKHTDSVKKNKGLQDLSGASRERRSASTISASKETVGSKDPPPEAQNHNEAIETLREREGFVSQICSDTSRLDVKDWVGRIFLREREEQIAEQQQAQFEERRRRRRCRSSSGTSDSGTHETGTTRTTTTLLTNAGRSNVSVRKAPSVMSDESLVVHQGQGADLMSAQERLRAYLADEIPELKKHVTEYIAKRSEEVRSELDDTHAHQFLRSVQKREVFDSRANFLRWQNTRRAALQLELEEKMPMWIWEAVQSWDQLGAMQARQADVVETDLIFDYLTKRAAHIDTSKLATEIPIVKAMRGSYSQPVMWRDKYL